MSNSRPRGTAVSMTQSIPEQLDTLYAEVEGESDVLNIVSRSNFALGFASALLLHMLITAKAYTEYSQKVFACVDMKLAIMDASLPTSQKH